MGRHNLNLMDRHYHADMLSVEEALRAILSAFHPLDMEEKPILSCLGQVLAEDIYSPIDIPPLDNSAMDGYALRSCLLYTSPSPRAATLSRMPSSA